MEAKYKSENSYRLFKIKMFFRLSGISVLAFLLLFALYKLLWSHRGANWLVAVFQKNLRMDYDNALNLYRQLLRNYAEMVWLAANLAVFLVLILFFIHWLTGYFDMINKGISSILVEQTEIRLPAEMAMTERKLYELKAELKQRTLEAQLAEQRKNELVMYLAHDIRTPLTSVIGYLNLLSEAPDMPEGQREKYVNITLDKAYRLEKMVNEFFEITRYNMQRIDLEKEEIDLYYMLVQLTDELSPVLAANGNTAVLSADENLTVYGDPDKLARVFNNILKNAAAYSFPDTEILISAAEKEDAVVISFCDQGKNIPQEKLACMFEKFYRLDEARASHTGGAGLGLAIAKEIVTLHGGTISAESENNRNTFTIVLPNKEKSTVS